MFHDEKTNLNSIYIQRRTQIDSTLTKINDKSNIKIIIFEILKKFENFINENKTYELSNHESNDHVINLKSNKKSFYDFIYSLFKVELKILRIYFDKHFKNDFIKSFIFSIDASILFVKKKNEILKFCVDYRNLNFLTIKNKYFLSLIDENLNRLNKIRVYTNLNMIATYNRFRIKKMTNEKRRSKHDMNILNILYYHLILLMHLSRFKILSIKF